MIPPVIIVHPESIFNISDKSMITLSLDAEGLRLSFSWQRTDGRPLTGTPRIEGASTSLLRIRDVEEGDAGGYVCEVSNAAGTVRSREATITVSKWYTLNLQAVIIQ